MKLEEYKNVSHLIACLISKGVYAETKVKL